MKKNILCFSYTFLLLALTGTITAQNLEIQGIVKDSASKETVPGATVYMQETSSGAQTNELGKFHFHGLKAGTYHLKIASIGYQSRPLTVNVNENTPGITVYLSNTPITLQEITTSNNRPLSESMSTISNFDKQMRPTNSAQDLLRLVPGLFLAQHQGGGKAEQIFLRGFDCDHGTDFAVFLDGMPVNMVSHAHGQGYADFHFVIPETIDKLTVSKGPYAAKYGDFATAGAGEFTTKNSLDRNLIKVEYGMFDTYRVLGMANLLGKKQLNNPKFSQTAYVAAEYNYTNSYFENKQHFYRYNIFGKYTARYKENTFINFSASTFKSGWNGSGQIPERAILDGTISRLGSVDPSEGGATDRTNLNLQVIHAVNDHSLIKNRVYYSYYNFNLFSNFTFFLEDSVHGDQINQTEKGRSIFGYQGTYENNGQLGTKKLTSIIGLTSRGDISHLMLRHSEKRVIRDTIVTGDLKEENAAAYLDETLALTSRLSINAGVRLDYFYFYFHNPLNDSLSGQKQFLKPSPKLNISYTINDQVQLFARSGYGFHSNDARSVVQSQVRNQVNLPTALGYEIGSTFKPFKNMFVNVALWGLTLQSELVYVGDGGFVEASGATKRMGVDLSARWQVARFLFLDADVNYNYGRFVHEPKGRDYIPLAPILTSVAGLTVKTKQGIGGSLRYRYMSDRPANEDYSHTAIGYFLTDAVLNYTTKHYQAGISVENLFNVNWNQAQFDTETKLKNESQAVTELCFTPGTPRFVKGSLTVFF